MITIITIITAITSVSSFQGSYLAPVLLQTLCGGLLLRALWEAALQQLRMQLLQQPLCVLYFLLGHMVW